MRVALLTKIVIADDVATRTRRVLPFQQDGVITQTRGTELCVGRRITW